MAIAHSSSSESHAGTTGSSNEASFNWTHTQTGTPAGVLVFVFNGNSSTQNVTGVSYGSSSLTQVSGASASDTTGEPGRVDTYFLGSGLPSGNQTVTVTRTNNATVMYATVATVTAAVGSDTDTTGTVTLSQNGSILEQNVDDGSPGSNSLRYAGAYTGRPNPPGAGTNSTLLQNIDFGSSAIAFVRETTAGQGSRPVGFNQGQNDDRAAVYLAVIEAEGPAVLAAEVVAFTLTGNDAIFAIAKNLTAEVASFSLTGNDATFTLGFGLNADPGAFALAGQTAVLLEDKQLTADAQSYALTGNDAGLHVVTNLDAETASFSFTANDATFTQSQLLTADPGSFSLTGSDVTLTYTPAGAFEIAAETGNFAVTGNDANLLQNKNLIATTDSLSLTGQAVTLRVASSIAANPGAFTVTGSDALLQTASILNGDVQSYALTGNDVTLTYTPAGAFQLTANTGIFSVTGNDVNLADFEQIVVTTGLFALTGNSVILAKPSSGRRRNVIIF